MDSYDPTSERDKDNRPVWTQADDAEYNRLATEMNEDSKLQFTLFTFGVTASTAILGFLTSPAASAISGSGSNTFSLAFLAPLIVLLPTSFVILNRARTRNRKAAYIMVCHDYKRLCSVGFSAETPLGDIRQYSFVPWETALHILDRTYLAKGRRVHRPAALKYMVACYLVIEILCILLAFFTALQAGGVPIGFVVLASILTVVALVLQGRTWMQLKDKISIQGYVEQWLLLKYGTIDKAPHYLWEWIIEYRSKLGSPNHS